MAGNGRGQMRVHASNRSQSFIFVGLLVVIAILCFNYWNVSSRNSLLSREITDLTDKIRQTSMRKISVEKRNDALMQQTHECSEASNKANEEVKRRNEEILLIQNQMNEKENMLNAKSADLVTLQQHLDSCQDRERAALDDKEECEKKTSDLCQGQVNQLEQDKKRLQEQLDAERVNIITTLAKSYGRQLVEIARNSHINVDDIQLSDIPQEPQVSKQGQNNQQYNQNSDTRFNANGDQKPASDNFSPYQPADANKQPDDTNQAFNNNQLPINAYKLPTDKTYNANPAADNYKQPDNTYNQPANNYNNQPANNYNNQPVNNYNNQPAVNQSTDTYNQLTNNIQPANNQQGDAYNQPTYNNNYQPTKNQSGDAYNQPTNNQPGDSNNQPINNNNYQPANNQPTGAYNQTINNYKNPENNQLANAYNQPANAYNQQENINNQAVENQGNVVQMQLNAPVNQYNNQPVDIPGQYSSKQRNDGQYSNQQGEIKLSTTTKEQLNNASNNPQMEEQGIRNLNEAGERMPGSQSRDTMIKQGAPAAMDNIVPNTNDQIPLDHVDEVHEDVLNGPKDSGKFEVNDDQPGNNMRSPEGQGLAPQGIQEGQGPQGIGQIRPPESDQEEVIEVEERHEEDVNDINEGVYGQPQDTFDTRKDETLNADNMLRGDNIGPGWGPQDPGQDSGPDPMYPDNSPNVERFNGNFAEDPRNNVENIYADNAEQEQNNMYPDDRHVDGDFNPDQLQLSIDDQMQPGNDVAYDQAQIDYKLPNNFDNDQVQQNNPENFNRQTDYMQDELDSDRGNDYGNLETGFLEEPHNHIISQ